MVRATNRRSSGLFKDRLLQQDHQCSLHPPSDNSSLQGHLVQGPSSSRARSAAETGTITADTIATALSLANLNSGSSLEKGIQPKWDIKHESFADFKRKVDIWASSHSISFLFERHPDPQELTKHDIAKRIVMLNLPNHDQVFVMHLSYLSDAWSALKSKYMPSTRAERRELYAKLKPVWSAG